VGKVTDASSPLSLLASYKEHKWEPSEVGGAP
jgi:hypothetical protein